MSRSSLAVPFAVVSRISTGRAIDDDRKREQHQAEFDECAQVKIAVASANSLAITAAIE